MTKDMAMVVPTIRDVGSVAWDGEPVRTTRATSFAITVEIGDSGKAGCDLFYLSICNPAWLSETASLRDWVWRDQMLVLATMSFANVRTAVEQKIRTEGPYESWPAFAAQMAPYMKWEFAES